MRCLKIFPSFFLLSLMSFLCPGAPYLKEGGRFSFPFLGPFILTLLSRINPQKAPSLGAGCPNSVRRDVTQASLAPPSQAFIQLVAFTHCGLPKSTLDSHIPQALLHVVAPEYHCSSYFLAL